MIAQRHLNAAEDIRSGHEQRAQQIRSQTQYTADAKAGMLARNYTDAADKMDELRRTATGDESARLSNLERKAFGISDLPGDPATAAVSFRDAQDRIAGIADPTAAHTLLARAERSGDEPLARAVAAHAYDSRSGVDGDGDNSWTSVLQAYIDQRPAIATAVQSLLNAKDQPMQSTLADAWTFLVSKPPELSSYSDYRLRQLAADDRNA